MSSQFHFRGNHSIAFFLENLFQGSQALKTPRGCSFHPPEFRPELSYPPIGDHIHHQGHLPLQGVGGSGGALYGCYELFGHHAAPMRVHRQVNRSSSVVASLLSASNLHKSSVAVCMTQAIYATPTKCSVAVRPNLLRPNAADVDHYQSKCANTRRACSVAVLDEDVAWVHVST